MSEARYVAGAAKFGTSGLWWVTGGYNDDDLQLQSTELYDADTMTFAPYVDLPRPVAYHNLVNINDTHMIMLGGDDFSHDVHLFDR